MSCSETQKDSFMKKLALFLALNTLAANQALADDTIVCKKSSLGGTKPTLVRITRNATILNDSNYCVSLGYFGGSATTEEVTQYEVENQYSLSLVSQPFSYNYSYDTWYQTTQLPESLNFCSPSLTKNQQDLLSSLKNISNSMICSSMGLTPEVKAPKKAQKGKQPAVQTKPAATVPQVLTSENLNKVSSCYCLSKIGSPAAADLELSNLYRDAVPEFVRKQYLDNLVTVRLNEYALAKNILGEEGKNACQDFANDKKLQQMKEGLALPPEINSVFAQIKDQDSANILFNLGSKTKGSAPVITEKVFKAFAEKWTCSIQSIKNPKKALSAAKEDAKKLRSMQTNTTVSLTKSEIQEYNERNASCTHNPITDKDEILQESYLQSMISDNSNGVPLLESITEVLLNEGVTAENFETTFKNLVNNNMREQCELSRTKLVQLGQEDSTAIFSDSELVKYLIGKQPEKALEIQKLHCSIMQRQLEKDPEAFLKSFCDFNKGDTFPPKSCPAIGDFMKAILVQNTNTGNVYLDQIGGELPDIEVGDIVSKLKNSKADDYAGGASKVRFENAGSYSSFMKTAADTFSKSNDSVVNMDMSSFSAERYTSIPTSENKAPTNMGGIDARKSVIPEMTTTQGNRDVHAYEGFNQEFKPELGPNPQQVSPLAPRITFNNKAIAPQVITTPQPTAAPVVSTTVIEKIVTPVPETSVKKEKKADVVSEKKIEVPEISKVMVKNESGISMNPSSVGFNTSLGKVASTQNSLTAGSQRVPSYQEALKSPSLIPEESLRSYIASRRFEQGIVVRKDAFDSKEEGISDMLPPETGIMLSAFRTGKIAGKNITKISLGDEIKDVKSFEQTNTFHGSVVIVEDQTKKERYICRAFVTNTKDGVEKLLPVDANAPGKDELGGYKCTTEKKTQETIAPLTTVEKKEAQKALSSNERLYKAFVLDKIVKGAKKGTEAKKKK